MRYSTPTIQNRDRWGPRVKELATMRWDNLETDGTFLFSAIPFWHSLRCGDCDASPTALISMRRERDRLELVSVEWCGPTMRSSAAPRGESVPILSSQLSSQERQKRKCRCARVECWFGRGWNPHTLPRPTAPPLTPSRFPSAVWS